MIVNGAADEKGVCFLPHPLSTQACYYAGQIAKLLILF